MSDLERMQSLLYIVLTRIEDAEYKIGEWKSKNKTSNPATSTEMKELKRILASQQRVKITLIQSIQELTPGSNAVTVFSPLKSSNMFFSKIKNFFRA